MPTRHLHLTRRGPVYYFRARLSKTLRDALGQVFLTVSLRTKEAVPARRMAHGCSAALDRLEALLVNAPSKFPPSKLQLRLVLETIFNRIINEGETCRDADPQGYARYAEGERGYDEPDLPSNSDEWSEDDRQRWVEWQILEGQRPEAVAAYWEGLAHGNISSDVQPMLDNALAAHGLKLDPADPQYEILARDATRVAAQAYQIKAERWNGSYGPHQVMPSFVAQKYPLDSALLRTWTTRLNNDEAVFLSRTIDEVWAAAGSVDVELS